MLENKELYEVERPYYNDYIHHIKSGTCVVETIEMDNGSSEIALTSKARGIKLCSRLLDGKTERYFIWEDLTKDEYQDWTPPSQQIELTSPKQVQALLNYINSKKKGK